MHANDLKNASPYPLPSGGEASGISGGPRAGRVRGERDQPITSGTGSWSLHYRQGFEEGRRTAVEDLLRSLLTISEEFIASESDDAGDDLRRIVYRFEEHLERRIWRISDKDDLMEDGLGI